MGASSKVLTCNHVMEMILEHQRCGDWRATFEKCVPGRKKFLDQEPAKVNGNKDPTSHDDVTPGTSSSCAAGASDNGTAPDAEVPCADKVTP